VISDVDGTVTKSDVLGHILPAIGGTWAHTNIVDLYSKIQNNGYRIIYLSSRAIGQSHQTKRYLSNVIQDSKTLPDGPVLLSPTSVLMAFRKWVAQLSSNKQFHDLGKSLSAGQRNSRLHA
jgi:phosphatidate phosphatase LPIN